MTAADSGSKTPKKANQRQWSWTHSTAAEVATPKVMNRYRKRAAAEESPLRQIFDEVCHTVDAGGNDVASAAIESSM